MKVTFDEITEITAETFGTTTGHLIGPRRDQPTCRARFAAMKIMREGGSPLNAIAAHFDRDHTSVINAINRVLKLTRTDFEYADKVAEIRQRVNPTFSRNSALVFRSVRGHSGHRRIEP